MKLLISGNVTCLTTFIWRWALNTMTVHFFYIYLFYELWHFCGAYLSERVVIGWVWESWLHVLGSYQWRYISVGVHTMHVAMVFLPVRWRHAGGGAHCNSVISPWSFRIFMLYHHNRRVLTKQSLMTMWHSAFLSFDHLIVIFFHSHVFFRS